MSKLGDVLHELAETVGRPHLHQVIEEVEKDELDKPSSPSVPDYSVTTTPVDESTTPVDESDKEDTHDA